MTAPPRPTHIDTMRERNLALVLQEIARRQPVTRARLAELTGLTKTTVTGQVAALEGLRLVTSGGPVREGARGRPGAPVSLAPGPVAGLGLEVNGHYLAACVLDLTGGVRLSETYACDNRGRDARDTLAALAALARQMITRSTEAGLAVVGTAVALPGVIAEDRVNAPNLGWDSVPAAALLDDALPVQTIGLTVDNEANLGALGERWYGVGRGAGSYIYLSGEIGIGAGIVVDGELFRSAHGSAGELGHVVVDPDGPACRCGGAGCLEQVAGLDAVLRAAGVSDTSGTSESRLSELLRRLADGDHDALRAVDAAGRGLAVALVGAVNLLDPDTIILGGLLARLAFWLIPPIEGAVIRGGGKLRGRTPVLRASTLEAGSAVRGAAGTVLAAVLADPLSVA
ncbi:ROK family transcriptional regulator [Embleya scabrispora]|uniref:ROK family transcriptional regulator n=1 Tax=Embleya scabrispora TaxID=159449 RepID=UPI00036488A1|nr:ROK family transcriptional regulator [Embleya scabrispora]MYS87742.1 ROK family protein [Streptomyces sp. SID5474]